MFTAEDVRAAPRKELWVGSITIAAFSFASRISEQRRSVYQADFPLSSLITTALLSTKAKSVCFLCSRYLICIRLAAVLDETSVL